MNGTESPPKRRNAVHSLRKNNAIGFQMHKETIGKCEILNEAEIIECIERGDEDALMRSIMPMVYRIMEGIRFGNRLDDVMSDGMVGALRAIRKFDPKRSKLSTYAYRSIQRAMWEAVRSRLRGKAKVSESVFDSAAGTADERRKEPVHVDRGHEHHVEYEHKRRLYEECLSRLDRKHQDILGMRANGLTRSEIGKGLGLTGERIRQIENEAIKKIQVMLGNEPTGIRKSYKNGKSKVDAVG